jgi:hypothetical protein
MKHSKNDELLEKASNTSASITEPATNSAFAATKQWRFSFIITKKANQYTCASKTSRFQ